MMEKEIKIDTITLQEAINKYRQALELFRPFTETFTNDTSIRLEPLDTQFTNELSRALKNMSNDISVTLLAELEAFCNDAQVVVDSFVAKDKQLADMMEVE
ncbi:hypothetical protein FL866_05595 [Listeria monocytogenes]|nr:hypothetical protein [Listeria monocytogenes]ECB9704485.1 hypothetical protein [Listeria monocytogenes]ECB9807420.1 hypothetical protein [Listeria monocytogenes]